LKGSNYIDTRCQCNGGLIEAGDIMPLILWQMAKHWWFELNNALILFELFENIIWNTKNNTRYKRWWLNHLSFEE
jgi:hypothetical protein